MEGEIERGGRGERGREWGREEGREGGREAGRGTCAAASETSHMLWEMVSAL